MNKSISKKLAVATVLLMMVVIFTSCNRGYGCPYELKAAAHIVSSVVK